MLKISLTFFIVALLCLVIYLSLYRKKRKKTKKPPFIARLSGLLTVLCFISSLVCGIVYLKQENIKLFNRINSYDVKSKYAEEIEKGNTDAAYKILPDRIFSCGNGILFANGLDDEFEMFSDENGITFKTAKNNVRLTAGTESIKAHLSSNGELILDGSFLYSKYDEQLLEYSNSIISKNVRNFSVTSNSLLCVTDSDDLYSIGFNEYGQLCDSTTKNKESLVLSMQNVKSADLSDTHALIIDKYGTLYACGDNSYSQLGTKNAISSTEPVKIMQGIKDVRAGNYFSLVLSVNGDLYTAGINKKGQLGNNGEEFRAELIQILTGIEKIDVNGNTCAALTNSGHLYVWGDNKDGKGGSDAGEVLSSPIKIADDVYDFALYDSGVAVLTKDRDIKLYKGNTEPDTVFTSDAAIPDEYREKYTIKTPETPETV